MSAKMFHTLEKMERAPVSELPDQFAEILRHIEEENGDFVLTPNGDAGNGVMPCHREETGQAEIEVDADLLEQVTEIIKPMGLTPEVLIKQFVEWCVAPETRNEAVVWLHKIKKESS